MEQEHVGNRVVKLSGTYPNLTFEDPTTPEVRRSARSRTGTSKGLAYEMEKVAKEEEKVHHQWSKVMRELSVTAHVDAPGKEEQLSQVIAIFEEARRLLSQHEQACRRIPQSQAPSDEIERLMTTCQARRKAMKVKMDEAQTFIEHLRQQVEAGEEDSRSQQAVPQPQAAPQPEASKSKEPVANDNASSRHSSRRSSRRSQVSVQERIRAGLKIQELEARRKLRQKAVEAETAAAAAAVAAAAAKKDALLEEELLIAKFAYKTAKAVEDHENEQELGSDDPDAGQEPDAAQEPVSAVSQLRCEAEPFVPSRPSPSPYQPPEGADARAAPRLSPNVNRSDVSIVGPPEIKTFNGAPKDWIGFVLAFEEVVAKRVQSNSLKLQKLIQFCSPKVRERIEIFQHDIDNGYNRAIGYLWDIFGHPSLIVNHVVEGLTAGQGAIRPKDREELLQFYHQVSCAIETVRALQAARASELNYDYMCCLENQEVLVKLLKRLPVQMATEFVDSLGKTPGSVKELCAFLAVKTSSGAHPLLLTLAQERGREVVKSKVFKPPIGAKRSVFMTADETSEEPESKAEVFVTETPSKCPCCCQEHHLNRCRAFNRLSPYQRRQILFKSKCCLNCFDSSHFQVRCEKPSKCQKVGCNWKGKHDPRIHKDPEKKEEPSCEGNPENCVKAKESEKGPKPSGADRSRQCDGDVGQDNSFCSMSNNQLFMGTVGVRLKNPQTGESLSCFAMLDPCSTTDVVTQEAVDLLGLSVKNPQRETSIHTVNGTVRGLVKTTSIIVSHVADGNTSQCLQDVKIVESGCFDNNRCPSNHEKSKWPAFASVVTREEVDVPKVLLLVSMKHVLLQQPECVSKVDASVYTVKTKLGHVVYGGGSSAKVGDVFFIGDLSPEDKLNRFLEVDQIAGAKMYDGRKMPSFEERKAAEKIKRSIRIVDGQYEVAVPWRDDDVRMEDNYDAAVNRVESLRRRFKKNPGEFQEYNEVIQSYIQNGHAEMIPVGELETSPGKKHYLFHHAVRHPRKKPRVVFNASRKVKGKSVNDQIMRVPDRLERLVGLLVRFREQEVAVTADIVAFFHNVRIPKEDQDFNRFIWFENGDLDGPVAQFRLLKHLFGGVASQCCAVMALTHCIEGQAPDVWSEDFCRRVIKSFYSDDFLDSFESADRAVAVVEKIGEVLGRGGFTLAKFKSNCPQTELELGRGVPSSGAVESAEDKDRGEVSALGIAWNLADDVLLFRRPQSERKPIPTKRGILSLLMSHFDPLGLLVPFILPLKLFLQDLVIKGFDWDEPIGEIQENELKSCTVNLDRTELLRVRRCFTKPKQEGTRSRQLHLFADGSMKSYGTCAYLRTEYEDGEVHCQLIMAKNKVCPAKRSMTVPRIELNAAVLAVRLARFLKEEMRLNVDSIHYWVDSVSTLRYINNKCKRFQVYVANRISEIQDTSDVRSWKFLKTDLNVADMASRPILIGPRPAEDPRVRIWFNGPDFLLSPKEEWPSQEVEVGEEEEDLELRSDAYATQFDHHDSSLSELLVKSPSLMTMKVRVAWLTLFCRYLRLKTTQGDLKIDAPTCTDLTRAEKQIVKLVQSESFQEEVDLVRNDRPFPKHSKVKKLSLFLDEEGILRVGTRLRGGDLPFDFKHPMLLPRSHHVSHLLVVEAHQVLGHQGATSVLSHLRKKFWIIGARPLVKSLLNQCLKCKRYHAHLGQQIMADLPKQRITLEEPFFTHTSVDLFGHFGIKRARSIVKRYVALFCCLSSRAVHLEVVASLEMDSFMDAFRRFQCRRGRVLSLLSDNATNFRSASKELIAVIKEWNDQGLDRLFRQRGVDWRFLPPRASHHGGVHERLIRSARACLRHVLDNQVLSDESFQTLVVECEFIMNSRPLTQFSDDPSDLRPLSPNDVLIPRPGPGLPPGPHPPGERFRRRWRTIQQLTCQFWNRFYKEYLNLLSLRTKWITTKRDFTVNDLVLVAEENVPRSQWLMGRVVEVFKGPDGHVRSCNIRTRTSVCTRPVVKICLLEATVD